MTGYIAIAKQAKDLTGQHFGRLIALGPVGKQGTSIVWLCQCECGNLRAISSHSLRRGHTRSCGCLQPEVLRNLSTTHDLALSPIYHVWNGMTQRCANPNHRSYHRYGGRGIKVCDEWQQDFVAFFNHVSQLSDFGTKGYSLDRINNSEGYFPGNVRWVSRVVQQRNTRSNRLITHNGKTQCLAAWADEIGIDRGTLKYRLNKGWDIERAFVKPAKTNKVKPEE